MSNLFSSQLGVAPADEWWDTGYGYNGGWGGYFYSPTGGFTPVGGGQGSGGLTPTRGLYPTNDVRGLPAYQLQTTPGSDSEGPLHPIDSNGPGGPSTIIPVNSTTATQNPVILGFEITPGIAIAGLVGLVVVGLMFSGGGSK